MASGILLHAAEAFRIVAAAAKAGARTWIGPSADEIEVTPRDRIRHHLIVLVHGPENIAA